MLKFSISVCAVRYFIRGRNSGNLHRKAICKKASQAGEERKESKSLPLLKGAKGVRVKELVELVMGVELFKML